MKFHAAALTLAYLASSASASVARPRDTAESTPEGKKFSLTQIPNENYKGPDAPAAYIAALAKYSPSLPEHIKQVIRSNPELRRKFGALIAAGKSSRSVMKDVKVPIKRSGNQTGTAVATPPVGADSEYVLPVDIGTPPQTIPLNLDTGSADL